MMDGHDMNQQEQPQWPIQQSPYQPQHPQSQQPSIHTPLPNPLLPHQDLYSSSPAEYVATQQVQWQPTEDRTPVEIVAITLPKKRIRQMFKISIFFLGIAFFIFSSLTVGLSWTNMSNLGGYIGLGVGMIASGVSIYIFFHKKYHACCLHWQDYIRWLLITTGVFCLLVIIVSNIPFDNNKQLTYVLLSLVFLLYSASLIWIAFMKPSLLQQISEIVRSVIRAMPEKQIPAQSLIAYLQEKYPYPEARLIHDITLMKDVEQITMAGTAIKAYRIKPDQEVVSIPQVPPIASQQSMPLQAQPHLLNDNPVSSASVQQIDILSPIPQPSITPSPTRTPSIPKPESLIRQEKRAVTLIFCYAHEDEALLNKLKVHLKPLQRQGLIDIWYDRNISAGTDWGREIDKHLNTAQVILLLVSPDFLASDYCYTIEMQRAIERHDLGEATVIPIILRHVYWHGAPFGKLQALPKDGKPVVSSDWNNWDEAFFDVSEGIRKAVEERTSKTSN
jgi:hypothetical protein